MSRDGSLRGLSDERIVGQFEEYGIPRHLQPGLTYLVQSWRRARVPPQVALTLWLLRQEHRDRQCLYWGANNRVEECTPAAIRYVQIAAGVGETLETDSTAASTVEWLLDRQLPDGGMPLVVSVGRGWTGQTARLLRVLHRLGDPALDDALDRMSQWLVKSALPQDVGAGWPYSQGESTVVTGSTSLAVLALVDGGERGEVVQDGLRYLVDNQQENGGWSEVPGYQTTVQHTFEAVRTIRAARDAGALTDDEAGPSLEAAVRWFRQVVSGARSRTTGELAYVVRLATELDLLDEPRAERFAVRLADRDRETLSARSDMFAVTELAAIALLECSRKLDATPNRDDAWRWRWQLPSLPPVFLAPYNSSYFYELLYGAVPRRWWIRFVDRVMAANVLERVAGLLFGVIVALGVVNPDLAGAVALDETSAQRIAASVLIGTMTAAWLGVRLTARSLVSGSTVTSIVGFVVAVAVTWIMAGSRSLVPDLVPVIGMKWVVIDAVSFTSDRTGLLDRLLPKP